jgi:hypothetical protein
MKPGLMLALVVIPVVLMSGCASVSRPSPVAAEQCWTDPEQRGERIRRYPMVTEGQALDAAERLLRLAGGDDMKIVRAQHSLSAEFHRERVFYLFLVAHSASVWDHWNIATRRETDGVRVCVQVRGQTFSDTFVLGAEPVTNAVYPASAAERDPGKRFKPPAHAYPVNHDTFWARLNYLLGLDSAWANCPSSGIVRPHATRGREEVNPLCHTLVDDPSAPGTGRR